MPDDKSKKGKPDRSRVSLEQAHERRYWCRALGVPQYVLFLIDDIRGLLNEMYNPRNIAPTVAFYKHRLSLAKGDAKVALSGRSARKKPKRARKR